MIKHKMLNFQGVTHGFFSSYGGVSKRNYKSLNCSYNNGDSFKNVFENYRIIKNIIKLNNLANLKQIHSNKVHIIKRFDDLNQTPEADGLVTELKQIGLCILTADCSPILFFEEKKNIVGACHAGWRGAVNGIIESTIFNITSLGGNIKNINAIIGPTIQKKYYEIGNDVFEIVKKTDVFKKNDNIICPLKNNKYLFDLPLFIKEKLSFIGIDKIGDVHLDTYINKQFFSHRRAMHKKIYNKNITGRQISIIGLI